MTGFDISTAAMINQQGRRRPAKKHNERLNPLSAALRNVSAASSLAILMTLSGCNNDDNSPAEEPAPTDNSPPVILGKNLGDTGHIILAVTAVDADFDGDLDVIATSSNTAWVYQNISTTQSPEFSAPSLYFASFSRSSNYRILHDLDNDGDLDALANSAAEHSDSIQFWYDQNVGSNLAPSYSISDELLTRHNCTGDWIGSDGPGDLNFPAFVDIDADGDLDLFIGEKGGDMDSGHYGFCENIGSANTPEFAEAISSDPFGLLGSDHQENYIVFGDVDNDGDYDAWTSYYDFTTPFTSEYVMYENVGTATAPVFSEVIVRQGDPTPFPRQGCQHPHFVDFDGDGYLDSLCPSDTGVFYLKGKHPLMQREPQPTIPAASPISTVEEQYYQ